MATPRSFVRWSDIQTEYGGTNPVSLAEYYSLAGASDTGPIEASNFVNTDTSEALTNEAIVGSTSSPESWVNWVTDFKQIDSNTIIAVDLSSSAILALDISSPGYCGIKSIFANGGTNAPSPWRVAVSGNNFFVTNIFGAERLEAYSYNPTTGAITFLDDLAVPCRCIDIVGNYAYLTSEFNVGVVNIVDISNPSLLTLAGSIDLWPVEFISTTDIRVDGNYAYVADQETDSLTILDVTNKAAPTLVSTLSDPQLNDAWALEFSGNYVYVGSFAGLTVVDVSNKAAPVIVENITSPNPFIYLQDNNDINALIIDGNYIWALQESGWVECYNITNPLNITYHSGVYDEFLNQSYRIGMVGNYLYGGAFNTSNISVIDKTDNTNPYVKNRIKANKSNTSFYTIRDGNYLYQCPYAGGGGVYIYDLSDGIEFPRLVGSVYNNYILNWIQDVKKIGNHLYLITEINVVSVNVSDPTNPYIQDWARVDEIPSSLWINAAQDRMYVFSANFGEFKIYEITAPGQFNSLGTTITIPSGSPGVVIDNEVNDYIYVLSKNVGTSSIYVIDVANPSAPTYVSTITNANFQGGSNAQMPDLYDGNVPLVTDGCKVGNYLYTTSYSNDSLVVWDISTPATPTYVTVLTDATNLNGISSVSPSSNGQYLYIAADAADRFTIVDITTPTTPTVVGGVSSTVYLFGSCNCFEDPVNNNYVWANAYFQGALTLIDVTTKSAPVIVNSTLNRVDRGMIGMTTNGSKMYVLSNITGGFRTYEISGEKSGHPLGSLSNVKMNGLNATMRYWYNHVFVVSSISNTLTVINVEDDYDPYIVTQIAPVWLNSPRDLIVDSGIAWIVNSGSDELVVVDVSDPANPVKITEIALVDGYAMHKEGDYLYVSCFATDELKIVDVTNPLTPSVVGTFTDAVLDGPLWPDVDGNYAYVPTFNSDRLVIVDITNKAAPTLAGSVQNATDLNEAFDVKVSGNRAYVLSRASDKVTIVDITNKAAPTIVTSVGAAATMDAAERLVLKGNRLYVASRNQARLTVLD